MDSSWAKAIACKDIDAIIGLFVPLLTALVVMLAYLDGFFSVCIRDDTV